MTNDEAIVQRVQRLVAEQLCEDSLPEPDATLESLGLDSLDTLEILMLVEEEFGIQISDDEVEKVVSVNGLARLVMYTLNPPPGAGSAAGKRTARCACVTALEQESTMKENITQLVWNGCDGYMDIDSINARFGGYNIERHEDGSATLYTPREAFTSIAVVEIDKADVPKDENGEMIFADVIITDDFRVFRAIDISSETFKEMIMRK